MKTKNILLPTDFSANARHAINYALSLFKKVRCRFYIMNAFEASPSRLGNIREKAKDTRLFQNVRSESESNIRALIAELETDHKNPLHQLAGHSIPDSLLNAIGKTAIDMDIDFIFMGTKGSSALKEVFMGSSTLKVIHNIVFCPIMAVPSNYTLKLPITMVFATNFEHIYSKPELIPLIEMAKISDARITIIHVDSGKGLLVHQDAAKAALLRRLQGITCQIHEIAGFSKISDVIMTFTAENEDVGMVAMINTRHSFFQKLTRERVIRQVAFHTEVPMLIVPIIDP